VPVQNAYFIILFIHIFMEPNDLNKVIKGTTTEADDEFMAQIADDLRTRKPMSPAERKRYDSINKAREEELKLQDAAFKLEKQGKLNMDMKEHFKARMNNQLNEVSIGRRMKKAISQGKSPLVAAAKALRTNIKIRGLRGAFSPIDYLERKGWNLQTARDNEPGAYKSPDLLVRAYDMAKNIRDRVAAPAMRAVVELPAGLAATALYGRPSSSSRTTRKIKDWRAGPGGRDPTNLAVGVGVESNPKYMQDRPIGDQLEQAYRATGGVSGVRDAQEMRKAILDLSAQIRANPKVPWWRGGPRLRDRYPFNLLTSARKTKPYERKTIDIPNIQPEQTREIDIVRGTLPGQGRNIPKK
jgi:hypothetical protein